MVASQLMRDKRLLQDAPLTLESCLSHTSVSANTGICHLPVICRSSAAHLPVVCRSKTCILAHLPVPDRRGLGPPNPLLSGAGRWARMQVSDRQTTGRWAADDWQTTGRWQIPVFAETLVCDKQLFRVSDASCSNRLSRIHCEATIAHHHHHRSGEGSSLNNVYQGLLQKGTEAWEGQAPERSRKQGQRQTQ